MDYLVVGEICEVIGLLLVDGQMCLIDLYVWCVVIGVYVCVFSLFIYDENLIVGQICDVLVIYDEIVYLIIEIYFCDECV